MNAVQTWTDLSYKMDGPVQAWTLLSKTHQTKLSKPGQRLFGTLTVKNRLFLRSLLKNILCRATARAFELAPREKISRDLH
jgi:hypothetical protein